MIKISNSHFSILNYQRIVFAAILRFFRTGKSNLLPEVFHLCILGCRKILADIVSNPAFASKEKIFFTKAFSIPCPRSYNQKEGIDCTLWSYHDCTRDSIISELVSNTNTPNFPTRIYKPRTSGSVYFVWSD